MACYCTDVKQYAAHGAMILERFFVNPATRMTPHLQYAQVIPGRNKNQGVSAGIIEMKDIYYYLDAVQLFIIPPRNREAER
ncbi:MAG: alginate lyase family protein [Bacillota bacterium]